MTDEPALPDHAARIGELEQELAAMRSQATTRLIQSELKSEAIRLGILDLDCLKLIETASLKPGEDGAVPEAAVAVARLKRDKPWMFNQSNSSHPAAPPAPEPPQPKTARQMTHDEWRTAREKLIKRA